MARPARSRLDTFCLAAAVATALYGGLLRYEAVIETYGWAGQPKWSEAIAPHLVPLARQMRPAEITWRPVREPYVGGDPINYIRYAREMRHFYQAHVREPVFLALTRAFLWVSEGRDIAVSFASALAGTLAVFAAYLLGAAAFSPLVGAGAALALAIEFQAVTWSADGWRDDTFMLFVTLSAWTLLRLQQRPTTRSGIAAGAAAAGACLTRITALSFVVPALLWIAFAPSEAGQEKRRAAAAAALVAVLLCGPYLVNCWRAFGDPLHAINYHARYYRHAEGLPPDDSVGALGYASSKLRTRPIATIDTALQGLITVPFLNKWQGWAAWSSAIGPALRAAGALGAVAALWSPGGRLLLLILLTSLVPYALTWSVGGGAEWRFTQHVYPIYLVLAFHAIHLAVRTLVSLLRRKAEITASRRQLAGGLATLAVIAIGWATYAVAPLLIVRETLAAGDAANITAGNRDAWFFDGAWSDPIAQGNVTVRFAQAAVAGIRLPLADRGYVITLRIDPTLTADPLRQPRVRVFFNRRPLADLTLERDPHRMGSYRIAIPREMVTPLSRLELLASHTVPAGEAGVPFESLPPDSPVAFRLWYVRLEAQ